MFWSGTTMSNLFSEPTLLLGRSGEARAVNNSGEFVGSRLLLNGVGQFIPKAFRSETNGKAVGPGEYLVAPFQSGVLQADVPSVALSINQRVGEFSGVAVGWAGYRIGLQSFERPAIWWPKTNGFSQPTNASSLELPTSMNAGHAKVIANTGIVYGWISPDKGSNRLAWRWPNGWTKGSGFDDVINVYGLSDDWQLDEIVDATDTEVLIGNGRKSGNAKAFLLVPQSVSN